MAWDVLERPQQPNFASSFGRSLGQGIGNLPEMLMAKRQQMADTDFGKKLGLPLSGKESGDLRKEAIVQALKGVSRNPYAEEHAKYLESQGLSPEEAHFIASQTPGAKTQLTKDFLEKKQRGFLPSQNQEVQQLFPKESSREFAQREIEKYRDKKDPDRMTKRNVEKELFEILSSQDKGLTPSEKVKRGKERFDSGLKIYQEAGAKLRGFSRDKERLDILDSLNKSDKLPKNLARANVDKEGNLRLPFASTPEAERYVKVLNEFSTGAKDTFGSRVTNFDLSQYLKRYPTLLNSAEGRKQLIKQMKIVNDINSVYYKNLKDIYTKAGGVRNIDADVAEDLAERMSEDKIGSLVEKFNEIGDFTSLPSASEFKGRKIKNEKTGEILISDGENWLPEA